MEMTAERCTLGVRMTGILDHIEKTLADTYRKEVDQTEHIWRSLPFFATTLALQFATISQLFVRLPEGTGARADWIVCMALIAASSVLTIVLLALSIVSVGITYIAPEPEILTYAEALRASEKNANAGRGQMTTEGSLAELK